MASQLCLSDASQSSSVSETLLKIPPRQCHIIIRAGPTAGILILVRGFPSCRNHGLLWLRQVTAAWTPETRRLFWEAPPTCDPVHPEIWQENKTKK